MRQERPQETPIDTGMTAFYPGGQESPEQKVARVRRNLEKMMGMRLHPSKLDEMLLAEGYASPEAWLEASGSMPADKLKRAAGKVGGTIATGVSGVLDIPANLINLGAAGVSQIPRAWGGEPLERATAPTITPKVDALFPQPTSSMGQKVKAVGQALVGGLLGGAGMPGAMSRTTAALGGAVGGATGVVADEALSGAAHVLGAEEAPWWLRLPATLAASGLAGSQVQRLAGKMDDVTAQIARDAQDLNVPLRAGDVKKPSSSIRLLEDDLQIGGGGLMRGRMEEQAGAMRGAVGRSVDEVAPAAMATDAADKFVADQLRTGYEAAKEVVSPLFDEAAQLAGTTPIPLTAVRSAITPELINEVRISGPGTAVARHLRELERLSRTGAPFSEIRAYQKALGAEIASLANTPGGNTSLLGAEKKMLSALFDDMDHWASQTQNVAAATAARRAIDTYKEVVVPYMRDDNILKVAVSRSQPIDLDAQDLIRNIIGDTGEGHPEGARLLASLLNDDGKDAVAYRIFARALDKSGSPTTIASEFLPGAANRALNLGSPARPTASRVALQEAGQEGRAESLQRLFEKTQRSTGMRTQPLTGSRLYGKLGAAARGGAGYAAGNALFGPIGGVIAGMGAAGAAGPMNNLLSFALTRPKVVRALMSQAGSPAGGLIGFGASSPLMQGLLDPGRR